MHYLAKYLDFALFFEIRIINTKLLQETICHSDEQMSRAGGSWGCAALACETWRGSIFHNNERIFEQADNYLVTFAFDIFVIRNMYVYMCCMHDQ